jgi:hypothetical protein
MAAAHNAYRDEVIKSVTTDTTQPHEVYID